jgi:hypothetical protein
MFDSELICELLTQRLAIFARRFVQATLPRLPGSIAWLAASSVFVVEAYHNTQTDYHK